MASSEGLEVYARAGLPRWGAVLPPQRGGGLGARLTEWIAAEASSSGVRMLYLLTTSAPAYFQRLGFRRIAREALSASLAGSAELRGACPESAVVMERSPGRS